MSRENQKKSIFLGLILLISILFRIISLNQSFWLDEAINVIAARDRGLGDLLFNYTLGDFHPPLYHIILWIWFKFVPTSEITARIPSLFFGVLTVLLTYKVFKQINKRSNLALAAALLLATSGLHIYYSQEARMYSLAALTTTLTFYALIKIKEQKNLLHQLLYFGSLVLMLFSDYQPWLLLPLLLYLLPGLTIFGSFLTLLFWGPTLIKQLENGLQTVQLFPAWGSLVGGFSLKSMILLPVKILIGRISIENNLLYAGLLLVPTCLAAVAILNTFKIKNYYIRVLHGWLFVPVIFGSLISLRLPIFSYFRFIFLLPAFYCLMVLGIEKLTPKFKYQILMIIFSVNIFSSAAYLFIPKFQREDWRGLASYLNQYQTNRTLVVFPHLAQSAGFEYYNKNKMTVEDKDNLTLSKNPKNIFLVRYVSEIFDPQESIDSRLNNDGYQRSEDLTFRGLLIWQYQK